MAVLWHDGFDHYGTDTAKALEGAWASFGANISIEAPAYLARTGAYALNVGQGAGARRVLGGDKTCVIVSMGYATTTLPGDSLTRIIEILDGSANAIGWLVITSDGRLSIQAGDGVGGTTTHQTTASPVITASTWHHIEAKFDVTNQDFVCYVDEVEVLNDTTAPYRSASGSVETTAAQVRFGAASGGAAEQYFDDIVVRDTAGTRNNDIEGDLRVATRFMVEDGDDQGWTAQPRKKFGNGILDNRTTDACVSAADAAALQLAAASYTIEGWVRFRVLPTTTNKATLFGKWQESGDQREWQLYKAGPDLENGRLIFKTSTDGAAGTVATVHSWPWDPELDRWYHVAVSRDGTDSMLFIDGVMQGTVKTDSATYFDGTGNLVIGGEMSSSSAVVSNKSFNGFMEEVRITNGVGRYTVDFSPPVAAFGRNVGADADFASVVVLSGFDAAITDESDYARTLTARNSSVQFTVDDGTFAYQTINQAVPRDDTFIEARLIAASGIFQFDAIPANNDTVTIGTQVYTWKTTLTGAADEIHREATVADTAANFIAAVNGGAGEGTAYGTGTVANADAEATSLPDDQVLVTAIVAGAAGNAIVSTETGANAQWLQGATLEGGEDIPTHSEFEIDPLDEDTTVVRSISIVHRAYKNEAGTAKIQVSLVAPNDDVTLGTERTLSTSAAYREEVFDEDPATEGRLTPSFISAARVRVDRTE